MQTRREFLKKSAALLGSAAVVGSVPGLLKAQAEEKSKEDKKDET